MKKTPEALWPFPSTALANVGRFYAHLSQEENEAAARYRVFRSRWLRFLQRNHITSSRSTRATESVLTIEGHPQYTLNIQDTAHSYQTRIQHQNASFSLEHLQIDLPNNDTGSSVTDVITSQKAIASNAFSFTDDQLSFMNVQREPTHALVNLFTQIQQRLKSARDLEMPYISLTQQDKKVDDMIDEFVLFDVLRDLILVLNNLIKFNQSTGNLYDVNFASLFYNN